jgi:hypothetical protein
MRRRSVQPNEHKEKEARNPEVGEWRSAQLAQWHPDQVPVWHDDECGPGNHGVHAKKHQEGNEQPHRPPRIRSTSRHARLVLLDVSRITQFSISIRLTSSALAARHHHRETDSEV